MHMQDGIGRGGYRLLATVFLNVGVLGLVTTLYAFLQAGGDATHGGFFDWLGFGLSFVSLVALFALTLVILWKRVPSPGDAAPTPAPAPARPEDFEFKPSAPETGPEVAVPLPASAPERPMVVPPNRNLVRDTKGWPRRQPPSGLTMGEKRELQAEAVELLASGKGRAATSAIEFEVAPPRPRNGQAGPARADPVARGKPTFTRTTAKPTFTPDAHEGSDDGEAAPASLQAPVSGPRTAIARVAGPNDDPGWNPEGTTTGKCGGCGTLLYAPQERPIRLRCPKCTRLTLLK